MQRNFFQIRLQVSKALWGTALTPTTDRQTADGEAFLQEVEDVKEAPVSWAEQQPPDNIY